MPNWYYPESESELNQYQDEMRAQCESELELMTDKERKAFLMGEFVHSGGEDA